MYVSLVLCQLFNGFNAGHQWWCFRDLDLVSRNLEDTFCDLGLQRCGLRLGLVLGFETCGLGLEASGLGLGLKACGLGLGLIDSGLGVDTHAVLVLKLPVWKLHDWTTLLMCV